MRCIVLAAVTTLLILAPAGAQTAPDVVAGDAAVNGSLLVPAKWSTRIRLSRPGNEHNATQQLSLEAITVHGKPAWRYVQVTDSEGALSTDTTIVMHDRLTPVSHRGYSSHRTLAIDFAGTHVTGKLATPDGQTRDIAADIATPAFDSGVMDLVISALPLAAGYRARLPLYIYERGGLVWHDLEVTGAGEVNGTPTWNVKVKATPFDVTYAIAQKSRAVLAVSADAQGATLRLVRN